MDIIKVKFLIKLQILLLFFACSSGLSQEEVQQQIDQAVNEVLASTSTLPPTTTTTSTTTTSTTTTSTTTTSTTTTTTTSTTTTSTTTTTTLPPTTTTTSTTTTSTTTTTTLPPTTTTVNSEYQICVLFLESYNIVANSFSEIAKLESDILNSVSNGRISRSSAYELQLEVIDMYSEWLNSWKNAVPNKNNIKFWNDYIDIYTYRALSAIALGQYYYYNNTTYFQESNQYLSSAVNLKKQAIFNSC